jgi:hypothetical protein
MASPILVYIGAALLAARALADPVSPLLDGNFFVHSSDDLDNNQCIISATSGDFGAYESVHSPGTGGEDVGVVVFTPQPTSTSRGTDKLSVKQSQFALLTIYFDLATPVSEMPIEKCSVSGSFSKHKAQGGVSVRCKGDNLSVLLSAHQITSLKTAMQRKHIKLTVDKANAKWSLSIDCNGAWFPL